MEKSRQKVEQKSCLYKSKLNSRADDRADDKASFNKNIKFLIVFDID